MRLNLAYLGFYYDKTNIHYFIPLSIRTKWTKWFSNSLFLFRYFYMFLPKPKKFSHFHASKKKKLSTRGIFIDCHWLNISARAADMFFTFSPELLMLISKKFKCLFRNDLRSILSLFIMLRFWQVDIISSNCLSLLINSSGCTGASFAVLWIRKYFFWRIRNYELRIRIGRSMNYRKNPAVSESYLDIFVAIENMCW